MVTLDSLASSRPSRYKTQINALAGIHAIEEGSTEQNTVINQALISAVHAFSARWLPVSRFGKGDGVEIHQLRARKEHFLLQIWNRAHKDVIEVLTRPSYRSILALYLFGTTPAAKAQDRQIADHCFETGLRHYLHLRARFSSVTGEHDSGNQMNMHLREHPTEEQADREFKHLEDAAYWFGIVIDGSRSLIRYQPSVLLSGLQGDSLVWTPIKHQTEALRLASESLQASKAVLTDETITTMIQHGSACKTLFWKTVSRIQDYLFYHTVEASLEDLLKGAKEEMTRFETVFNPFFDQCARDWILLSEKSRLSFCKAEFSV